MSVWRGGRLLAAAGLAGVLVGGGLAPTAAMAQESSPGTLEATPTALLAGAVATLGTGLYAPFKALILCPVSALGAGAAWLATGGEPAPAERVLQVGCGGAYAITPRMVRGQQEFRNPDDPQGFLRRVEQGGSY